MQLPRDIISIIRKYLHDIQLLDTQPIPGSKASIRPLNFEIVFGVHCLADLLLMNILDGIQNTSACSLLCLLSQPPLSNIIHVPLQTLSKFELCCKIFRERCDIWGEPEFLPPSWKNTLPYLILTFLLSWDMDDLARNIKLWLITDPYLILQLP
jgi:hypothetical protein